MYFAERFASRGIKLEIPDLAAGDFENLTISSQLAVIDRLATGEPVSLIGSSMGGYLAALYASMHPEIQKVVLLAPAFYFPLRWPQQLGPERTAGWKESGFMEVFHYGEGRARRLNWALMEDARRYPAEPSFTQPALIFHGSADDVVPPEYSVAYAALHPNVILKVLDSDHQLTDAVQTIWAETEAFLAGCAVSPTLPGPAV